MNPEITYQKIEALMAWYYNNSEKASIDQMLTARDKIAVLSCNLADETADAFQQYNHSYFIRKVNTSRKVNNLTKANLSVNKAEHQAIEDLEDIWEKEKEDESHAHRNDLLLKQVNKVLDSISQRISYLKDEKRNMQNTQI